MRSFVAFLVIAAASPLYAFPFKHNCQKKIQAQLGVLRSLNQWTKDVAPGGGWSYRSPTKQFGHWVEVFDKKEQVQIRRFSAKYVDVHSVNSKTCKISKSRSPFKIARTDAPKSQLFTDVDLKSLMKAGKPGMIVIWSPLQIYSIQHYKSYAKISQRLGLPIDYLVSPHAPEKAVRAVQAKSGTVKLAERRLASVELTMRGGSVHTPTAFVYGWNKISPAIIGVMDEETLTNTVLVRLGELSQ